jgi:integrase
MPHRRPDSTFWWISYTNAAGKRIRESSGTEDHAKAKALEAERNAQVHRVTKWGDTPDRTVTAVLTEYLGSDEARKLASAARDTYAAIPLQRHLGPHGVMSLRAAHIQAYKDARRQEKNRGGKGPVKDATLARELQLLSRAIDWANVHRDWGLPDPTEGRVPEPDAPDLRWLTLEQVQALLVEARKFKRAPHLEDFIELGVMTGMRRGEMLRLEWSRVDFQNGLILFGREDQKKGMPGSIPMNNSAREVLVRMRAKFEIAQTKRRTRGQKLLPATHVFCNRFGKPLFDVGNSFDKAAANIGMPEITPHWLRHTFASWLVQRGVPLAKVQVLCRHEDIRTTMRYAHLAPKDANDAVHVLDGVVSPLMSAPISGPSVTAPVTGSSASSSRFGHVPSEAEKTAS